MDRRPWLTVVVGVLVVPMLVLGALTAASTATPDPSDARVVSAAAFEAEYGIRFDLVGVTAAGGLVDLRFTVVDGEKAGNLFHSQASSPVLYTSTGTVLRMKRGMIHHLSLVTGGRYFVLYSNRGGTVQAGTIVSVVIDGIRTEPIRAQS